MPGWHPIEELCLPRANSMICVEVPALRYIGGDRPSTLPAIASTSTRLDLAVKPRRLHGASYVRLIDHLPLELSGRQ